MVQYIINLTSIWLTSLLVFDIFLKKESFHSYNRLFLNITLLLGVLLPLWSWQPDAIIYSTELSTTIANQASTIRTQVASAGSQSLTNWQTWLLTAYLLGMLLTAAYLFRELIHIVQLYKGGEKTSINGWTIIETNMQHSPFSAYKYIFISSKSAYSSSELSIVLTHEQKHIQLLHFIDLLFITLLKVVFWFNPLIYLFEKRLLMVHEYQADASIKEDKSTYGKFLVEQSILKSAPILSHSFIRSPLKSRIKMLTKQSKRIANLKQLIIAPLVLFTLLCFTQNNLLFAQEKKVEGNNIYYKGNTIELTEKMPDDTVYVSDPVTGEIQMVITSLTPSPAKLNGVDLYKKYYRSSNLPPLFEETIEHIKTEIKKNLNDALNTMEEGSFRYAIENLIVDQKGKIIYYELAKTGSAFRFANGGENYDLQEDVRNNIEQKIVNVLDNLKVDFFLENGKPVPYIIFVDDYFNIVK